MFEMPVDDIFTLTGVGTVFVGKVLTGSISIGDRIVCRTPSTDVPVRVIAVQDGSGKPLKRGEPGILIGVVCNTIDLAALPGTNAGSADIGQVVGVRLVTAPEKKRWWQ
jgi:translation elongation factor EF-1alpha